MRLRNKNYKKIDKEMALTEILYGKPVADRMKEELASEVIVLKEKGIHPHLAILRVGASPNDLSYEKGLRGICEKIGVALTVHEFEESAKTSALVEKISDLNVDETVSGILVFQPLPSTIDGEKISEMIHPVKDVDCMKQENLANLFFQKFDSVLPATPAAVMALLDHYSIDVKGKLVSIVNRSTVFGKPMAMMLLARDASPVLCHSKTQDLDRILRDSDICIVATGRAKMFGPEFFTEKSIVIDVGVSEDEDGKMSGDADFTALKDYVARITPVPRGVGSITSTVLMGQVVKAAKILAGR